jgi:hypothetical protein
VEIKLNNTDGLENKDGASEYSENKETVAKSKSCDDSQRGSECVVGSHTAGIAADTGVEAHTWIAAEAPPKVQDSSTVSLKPDARRNVACVIFEPVRKDALKKGVVENTLTKSESKNLIATLKTSEDKHELHTGIAAENAIDGDTVESVCESNTESKTAINKFVSERDVEVNQVSTKTTTSKTSEAECATVETKSVLTSNAKDTALENESSVSSAAGAVCTSITLLEIKSDANVSINIGVEASSTVKGEVGSEEKSASVGESTVGSEPTEHLVASSVVSSVDKTKPQEEAPKAQSGNNCVNNAAPLAEASVAHPVESSPTVSCISVAKRRVQASLSCPSYVCSRPPAVDFKRATPHSEDHSDKVDLSENLPLSRTLDRQRRRHNGSLIRPKSEAYADTGSLPRPGTGGVTGSCLWGRGGSGKGKKLRKSVSFNIPKARRPPER